MVHPNHAQIRRNRMRLWLSRSMLVAGVFMLVLDYYLTFLNPYWDFQVLLWMFIFGCSLIVLAFSGKFLRMRRSTGIFVRKGQCIGCGACCRLPVRCIFLSGNRCRIYKNRPRQCRSFPSSPRDLVSHDCGYWFEEA
mgnify:CR=1 FL=1